MSSTKDRAKRVRRHGNKKILSNHKTESNTYQRIVRAIKPRTTLHFKSGDVDTTNADMRPVTLSIRIFNQHTGGSTSNLFTGFETDYSIAGFNSGRATAFADLFSFYRIVGLRYKAKMSTALLTSSSLTLIGQNNWFVAFPLLPKSTFTAPTTVGQFVDFPYLHWDNDQGTIKFAISRKELLSGMPYKWLKTTTTGSIPDDEYIQMCHEVCNTTISAVTASSILTEVVDLDLEFAGAMDPALNPLLPSYLHPRHSFDFISDEKKELK